jgi:hypothetical protein
MKQILFIYLFACCSCNIVAAQSCTPAATIAPAGAVSICQGGAITLTAPASNVWTQKANFGGTARYGAVALTIGGKGYIGTGRDATRKNDFWEYDPATNSWAQKANFGGTARYFATGFTIGAKGYIGTGRDVSGKRNDFWEYDPATNTWTQKANFGGGIRDYAVGISIGSKGYIGTGSNGTVDKNDFWEYDPATNTWTQKANFGGTARESACGFTIGAKGYIGTGWDGTNEKKDFWEYDQSLNTWLQKADFGSTGREGAAAFSIGNKGYIGTGWDGAADTKDIWEYNQATNAWTQKADFGGGLRELAVGFSIGPKGYFGTGWDDANSTYKKDFWEYDPGYTYAWSSGQITQSINISTIGSYTVTITNTLNCSHTSSPTIVSFSNTWPGGGTSDWNTASNWSCGTVPNNSSIDVVIANTAVPMPVLNTDVSIRNLLLNGAATLALNNNRINIHGNINGTGSLSGSAASSVTLNGTTGNLKFTSGAEAIKDLLLNSGASVSLISPLHIIAGTAPGSVTINNGAVLNTGGNLVLQSDAAGTARMGNSGGTVNGDVTVERFIPARRAWRLLTVPLSPISTTTISQAWQDGQQATTIPPSAYTAGYGTLITTSTNAISGFDKGSTNNPSIKYYDGSSWLAPGATTIPANTFPGYMLFVRGDRNFIIGAANVAATPTTLRPKVPINIGTQTIANNVGTGFQVIGNPFASAINFHSTTRSGMGDIYYLWDPKIGGINGTGGFVTFAWNSTNGNYDQTVTGAGTTALPNDGTIESGAAFVINFTGAGNLQIKETDKTNTSSANAFGRPAPVINKEGKLKINLCYKDTDSALALLDGVLICYNNLNNNHLDNNDAQKLQSFSENLAISVSNKNIAIERRQMPGLLDTVFLTLTQLKTRHYILDINPINLLDINLYAFLHDAYTHQIFPVTLSGATQYSFTVNNDPASYSSKRFYLEYKSISVNMLPTATIQLKATKQDNNVEVQWTVQNENNTLQYEVEKSDNGYVFNKTYTLQPNASKQYNWIDLQAIQGDNFYRIKKIGQNGSIENSGIVKISAQKKEAGILLYPNPVSNKLSILQLNNLQAGIYAIHIYNSFGQLQYHSNLLHSGGTTAQTISIPQKLADGGYTLDIINCKKEREQSIPFIIQRNE